jgi:hypothetical protein
MSCKTSILLPALIIVAAASSSPSCGNYSNEDLEFMNALPERQDLSAEVPARSAVGVGAAAELYVTTRNVTTDFNRLVDGLLALIDAVRSYSPTTRHPNQRIWGPFPADKHPGWVVQLRMERQADLATFDYWLEMRPAGGDPATWFWLIKGSFAASGGVRKGTGQVELNGQMLRGAGLDPGIGLLDLLTVDYKTDVPPIMVTLAFNSFPDPTKADAITQGTYRYSVQQDGQGALNFDFWANSVPGPLGLDKFNVTSRWLGTGEGRSDVQVVSGDGAGAMQTECWDAQFQAVYNLKPWAPAENLGDLSACATIPLL